MAAMIPRWLRLSYILSWMHADLHEHTTCRLLGHIPVTPEQQDFLRLINQAFGHPPNSDVWDLICSRCGATIGRLQP